ncbi:putative bifunctional diguanylate cyclase/phosphodiesterase [Pengzhenrongella frigida]|uniref:Bifunctional diguanylate cyclase/phosphodiesterase n=1 Tax=Pengzhenrongella frigida TaxID=1259133 RepID=A0A4V1ZGR0_9MICO|nr:bifunctional diguanylate cyclase/phosphodiesterase [Cellulomonas sp. HLT2-17]RYV49414.1 bifunctional diguanylate cyclase/phosphodiesterase [Cellulomonas sp. HLT2-17]
MKTIWWRYLIAGVVVSAGVFSMPVGLGRDLVYCLIGASGTVAIVIGVRRHGPPHRRGWHLMAAGNAAWVLGDAIYAWFEHGLLVSPFPSVADVAYLAAYPMLAGGLLILVRSRGPENGLAAVLDSAILTVGLALVSWVFLLEPTWTGGGAPILDRIVAVAYPVGDVLLFAVLMRVVTARRDATIASLLLTGSLVAVIITDSLFVASTWVAVIDAHAQVLDLGWLAAYVLWGAAALHPSMRGLSVRAPTQVATSEKGRLAALAGSAAIVPGVLAVEVITKTPLHVWAIIIAASAFIVLFGARMLRMVGQLEHQSAQLSTLAGTDYLTGLANRRQIVDHLAWLLDSHHGAEMLVINVERFNEINDVLGDRAGEAILQAVGARLETLVGTGAMVARVADHRFGVLDPSLASAQDAEGDAARIHRALELPFDLPELNVSVEVSAAVLVLPQDASEPAQALHRADIALAAARRRPGRVARYQAKMESGGALALLLIGELADALRHGDLVLHYQPQVDLRSARVFAVEALVRWQHPKYGLLGPGAFIPAAEQSGLIGPLTQYVLDRALAQNARWHRDGLDLTVAVNLSARNLLDPHLVDHVSAALGRHGLDAGTLELEITESSAMVDPRRCIQVLTRLATMGVTLSVDDYGTGHSSLAYLQRLPVTRLKIDQSFVTNMVSDQPSAAIVRSTIELARNLHLDVVAEGVENDETLLALRDMHCPGVQGYGLGRPVPPPQVPELITRIESRIPEILRSHRPSAPSRHDQSAPFDIHPHTEPVIAFKQSAR